MKKIIGHVIFSSLGVATSVLISRAFGIWWTGPLLVIGAVITVVVVNLAMEWFFQ